MKNKITSFLKFFLPFGVWILLFREILTGEAVVCGDSHYGYVIAKGFIENWNQGVFRLWNPYLLWGFSELIYNNSFGFFNPLWFLALCLYKAGLPYYFSIVYTSIIYFFVCTLGFYLLVKAYLKDSWYAYLSFLMMLFSANFIFTNILFSTYTLTPMVWSFYFWLKFCDTQRLKFFIGFVFTLMIVACTYFPPLWLTVWTFFFFAVLITNFSASSKAWRNFMVFARKNFFIILICFFMLSLSSLAAFKAFQISKSGEVVFIDRHKGVDKSLANRGAEMSTNELVVSSAGLSHLLKNWFSGLNLRGYRSEYVLIPLFPFLVFLLSVFNPVTRRSFALFLLVIFIFFAWLGPAGGLHVVFYKILPFFRLIHSLSIFSLFFFAAFILFTVSQLRFITQHRLCVEAKQQFAILFVVHLGLCLFLMRQGNNLLSSYLTIFLSFIYFCFIFFFKKNMPKSFLQLILLFCIIVQPLEAAWHYSRDPYRDQEFIKTSIFIPRELPKFSYMRPRTNQQATQEIYLYHRLRNKDYIRFMGVLDFPLRWTAYLSYNIPEEIIEGYVEHKFYLYDHVEAYPPDEEAKLEFIQRLFKYNLNTALVDQEQLKQEDLRGFVGDSSAIDPQEGAIRIVSPSDTFDVVDFNLNAITIKTDFAKDKFIVYTDSYHKDWRLFINGKPKNIYQANVAFKGFLVPHGKNNIYLEYAPLGGSSTYFFVWGVYFCMFLWVIILFLRDRARAEVPGD